MHGHSPAWTAYSYISFGCALGATLLGVWMAPVDLALKGYLAMGILFLTGSTFTLAKTLRDSYEADRFHNRIEDAKTERLLKDVDLAA